MQQLFQNILTASFHGSIVILVVLALRLVLKKAPKKFLCFLWLLAGIRLLMPFEIQSSFSLQPQPEQVVLVENWQGQPEKEVFPQYFAEDTAAEAVLPAEDWTGNIPEESLENAASSVVTSITVEERNAFDWVGLIPWVWLAVASLFLIYTVWSYLSLKHMVRESVKIPGGWECDRIETAFILGFIRPKIYIPMGLSKMVRKHILAHERTHLEKGDHWFKMIGFIALALHWFNPLVWVAYILLCKDIEMACDERVVQFMDLQERKEYSAALLNCSTSKAHFAACPVAFGEVSVKERIKSVLRYKRPSFWISLMGVIAIIFVAVCLVTSPVEKKMDTGKIVDTADGPVVKVSNVDEFLSAIASNTVIEMEAGSYDLTTASNYGEETGTIHYSWANVYDGYELVLFGVENLTIRGSGKHVTTLETQPRYANVLYAQNCANLQLEDFTSGHTKEQGECSGGVLYLQDCTGVDLNRLGLYGCGVTGLRAELSSNVNLSDSDVYDCSSAGVVLATSSQVTVSDCRFYNIGSEQFGGYSFLESMDSEAVTIENCEFSDSTVQSLAYLSRSAIQLRNNFFHNNRVRDAAFSIEGENTVLVDNKFTDNNIRTWYSGYSSFAKDQNGQNITEFTQTVTKKPEQETQPQLEIHVSTVDELIAAIGPNKEIILDSELYDFSTATGYGTSKGDYYYWEDIYDGPGLVIKDVENMTIRSSDGDVKGHTIAAIPRYADVLAFSGCSNVTISGFTAGHTKEQGSCAGGVIEFRDCDNMTVDNCGLFGCGILGVQSEYGSNITVKNCDIYECSQGGIKMWDTDNITISGNNFRDLGGEETSFIGCTNINLDGQVLNSQSAQQETPIQIEAEIVVDEQDLHNMGEVITAFATAMFQGDEGSMKLHLSSQYDQPIKIPEDVLGSAIMAEQIAPVDYAREMEAKGYCTVYVNYRLPDPDVVTVSVMTLEMCRENGIWRVQYYSMGETEIELLDKDLWNFFYAYLEQDLEGMEMFLSEEYTGTVDVYFGSAGNARLDPDYSVGDTFSNAQLAGLDSYSAAIPFKEDGKDAYTYLNVALRRRENPKTFEENGNTRHEPEWEVLDYGIENQEQEPNASNLMYLPGNIQIETIERENYTGTVMLIEDPSRVFLGTSTSEAFSKDIPGKRINEMFDVYPEAIAAVNAGAFFDDGTASAAVGSYPLGLTVSNGKIVWSQAQGIAPGIEGFVGFNSDDKLVVLDHNLTPEEAETLDIRDGVGMGPALIIDREVLPAAETNSGYNPRTAIGQKEDGTVILLCINGRVANSLGATYGDVANEMMTYGAESACLLQGGSATGMMCRMAGGDTKLISDLSLGQNQPRRLPTYWMVAAD